jgi:hypothetical protein
LAYRHGIARQAIFKRAEEERIKTDIAALKKSIAAQIKAFEGQAIYLNHTAQAYDQKLMEMDNEIRSSRPITQDECRNICDMIAEKLPREQRDSIYDYLLPRSPGGNGTSWKVRGLHSTCSMSSCSFNFPDVACMCKGPIWNVDYMGSTVRNELAHQWLKVTNLSSTFKRRLTLSPISCGPTIGGISFPPREMIQRVEVTLDIISSGSHGYFKALAGLTGLKPGARLRIILPDFTLLSDAHKLHRLELMWPDVSVLDGVSIEI